MPARRYLGSLGLIATAAVLSASCSSSSEPDTLCSGTVTVSASVGSDVVFQWADCEVQALAVYDTFGRVIWSVEGTFGPPVSYGTSPAGSTTTHAAEALQSGSGYSVSISAGTFVATSNFVR